MHSLRYTYPIAVGRKGISHEEVELYFSEELLSFRSGQASNLFYSHHLKSSIPAYLELFTTLQDQPEHRSCNNIMLGNSTYTARWGYAIDIAAVCSGVPCCCDCFSFYKYHCMDNTPIPRCEKCTQWKTDCQNGRLDFSPPRDFPMDELPVGHDKLRPLQLSYNILLEAVEKSHNRIVSGAWSLKNVRSFLQVHGLNSECINGVLQCPKNYRLLYLVQSSHILNDNVVQLISQDFSEHPEKYTVWKAPAIWTQGTDLVQSIDVVMHLLYCSYMDR